MEQLLKLKFNRRLSKEYNQIRSIAVNKHPLNSLLVAWELAECLHQTPK